MSFVGKGNYNPQQVWELRHKLNNMYSLSGRSIGARCSGFKIPELQLYFDAGVSDECDPKFIFITHAHLDHFKALSTILMGKKTQAKIFVSKEQVDLIKDYCMATLRATKNSPKRTKINALFYGVSPGETKLLKINKREYIMKFFKCYHTAPTVGYGLTEIKNKLKQEYVGMEGKEIGLLKKQGIEITKKVEDHVITYLCDTTHNVFNDTEVFKYKHIVIECNFLYEEHKQDARDKAHMHWSNLYPVVKAHPKNTFILVHFSFRYTNDQIQKFFSKKKDLDNVVIWLN
jgi:ribonuclease Z